MTHKILGVDDEVTTCERCGKRNLKRTIVIERSDAHGSTEIVRYGSDCAARVVYGREHVTRTEASKIEARALAAILHEIETEIRPILHVMREERPGLTFVRVPAGLARAGQRWGRAFTLADGRTFLHFDYVITTTEAAEKLVPGKWIKLAESKFVGIAK